MITSMALVKQYAGLATRLELGEPTTDSVGVVGDIWLDNEDFSPTAGKTWELIDIITTPTTSYVWRATTMYDMKINLGIQRVEQDFKRIRGADFEIDSETGDTTYPDGADHIAAEMVCYLMSIGKYVGRGMLMEGTGDRTKEYEDKVLGYPYSIVGAIDRFVRMQ